jgi:hypothetical protein
MVGGFCIRASIAFPKENRGERCSPYYTKKWPTLKVGTTLDCKEEMADLKGRHYICLQEEMADHKGRHYNVARV